jgi:hypothetical protein
MGAAPSPQPWASSLPSLQPATRMYAPLPPRQPHLQARPCHSSQLQTVGHATAPDRKALQAAQTGESSCKRLTYLLRPPRKPRPAAGHVGGAAGPAHPTLHPRPNTYSCTSQHNKRASCPGPWLCLALFLGPRALHAVFWRSLVNHTPSPYHSQGQAQAAVKLPAKGHTLPAKAGAAHRFWVRSTQP